MGDLLTSHGPRDWKWKLGASVGYTDIHSLYLWKSMKTTFVCHHEPLIAVFAANEVRYDSG